MTERSKVTLRDIAQKANVSTSTVSRALNGFAFVEESTRAAIVEAAQELGYVVKIAPPKAAVQKTLLMLVRSSSSDPGREMSMAGVERRISNGVIDICQMYGIASRIQPVEMTASELHQFAHEPALLGTIFLGGLIEPNFARAMQALDLPFVVAGAHVHNVSMNSVTADYAGGMEQAVHHLAKNGRTRIALVNGSPQTASSLAKYKGYRLALAMAQLAFDATSVQVGDFSSESGYAGTAQILVDAPDVDAILYASDEMAIGGLHALKEHGREVPTDVAVIGFHNMHAAQFTDPPLTSVEVDLRQMGQIAGQRLYHLALDASQARSVQPPWTVLVPTTLVVRRSA